MRLAILVIAGAVACAPSPREGGPGERPLRVTIGVRCSAADGVVFSIKPWTAHLRQGGEIEWRINGNANTDAITIESKQGAWPFTVNPPYNGTKQNPARGTDMKPNQTGQRFAYQIRTVCQSANYGPDTLIVDPDMVVD